MITTKNGKIDLRFKENRSWWNKVQFALKNRRKSWDAMRSLDELGYWRYFFKTRDARGL